MKFRRINAIWRPSVLNKLLQLHGKTLQVFLWKQAILKEQPNTISLKNVYKVLGIPQEAIACYQHALQVRPDNAVAFGLHVYLGFEECRLFIGR
ncbi:hypothetical protein MKW98_031862 [Papaver atlanticum]|uniref:Uncharacterized protein n=1 Tax=Papaver atlanticum TaxID=357466 RepID=A0AAD4SDT4_9MAGN|nr:hypothetical protein MKW98_031862 [Papaver atlanticum]